MRIRRGDTLIELVIATALFATLLISVLPITNFIRVSGEESSYYLNSIVRAINMNQGVQDEWESAQRMQSGKVNPQNITSIAFKKSFSLITTSDNWIEYSIVGPYLNRYSGASLASLTQAFKDIMTPLDSNNHYIKWTFYTIDGKTLASNLGSDINVVTGLNDVPTTYWILKVIYAIKGYPFVISSIREVTPLYDNPTLANITSNIIYPYIFNQAMDTNKYGTWSDDFTSTTYPSTAMSNYMGIPYKDPSEIRNVINISGGIQGQLYDPLHHLEIAGKEVYCFLSDNTFISATTDSNGIFTFYGVILPPYTIKFNGDDTYVPCTYKSP